MQNMQLALATKLWLGGKPGVKWDPPEISRPTPVSPRASSGIADFHMTLEYMDLQIPGTRIWHRIYHICFEVWKRALKIPMWPQIISGTLRFPGQKCS